MIPENGMQVEVVDCTDESGAIIFYEIYRNTIVIADFEHGNAIKSACEVCPKHGKNFACPPYSPAFPEYLPGAKTAEVICIRLPQEYFSHEASEARYRACFHKARNLLVDVLRDYRRKGYAVAGSGPCEACGPCSIETGSARCEKPRTRIYSLESLGVNVIALARKCFDMDFEWNIDGQYADFVCAVGAVFFE